MAQPPATESSSRPERILAYMAAAVVGVALVAIFVVLFWALGGGTPPAILMTLPLVGFPIGALLIIALVIVSATRRRRDSGHARR